MLAIITTHPIQYQVPIWQEMAKQGIPFEVWYFTDFGVKPSYDSQFGQSFAWDLDNLTGYNYRFLKVNKDATPNKGFFNLRLNESIIPLIKQKNITHVWINGWQVLAYWQAIWDAHKAGAKIIFRGETNDIKPHNSWKEPIRKLLLERFFSKVSFFLYIGQSNKRFYESYQIHPSQLLPGHYCVDNQRFAGQAKALLPHRQSLRTKYGIANDSFCLLFSGKFIDKKRPLDILNATMLLPIETRSKLHVLFVGSGQLEAEIKKLCKIVYENNALNTSILPTSVHLPKASFLGFLNQNEIVNGYAAADCLALPSNFGETWGLVVNEAMACGLPAIVSNQCGSAEDLVLPIDHHLMFECDNIAALAASIQYILTNKIDKVEILNHISKYSFQSTIDSIKKILTEK